MSLRSYRSLVVPVVAAFVLAMPAVAHAGQVGVTVSIQGSGSTQVVEGTLEDGASTVCDWTSNKDERVTNTCARVRNEELFEAWVWLRATPSTVPSGHWSFAGWSGCDETRVRDGHTECAVHSGAANNVERAPKATFVDNQAPTVSAVTESFSTAVERRVAYFFSTDEGQLQCRFDSDTVFSNCSSGISRDYSTEGAHTLDVRAIDPSGQVSSSSSRTVVVVDTALVSGPSGLVNSRTANFTFASGAGTGFMCSLDSAAYTSCPGGSISYAGISDGAHTLRVYATNGGWYDRIPVVRTWTVDATPPETVLSEASGPAEGSSTPATGATFTFSSVGGSSFECRVDSGSFTPCSPGITVSGLSPGGHTFEVRAKDAAGNVDPTPSKRTWTVEHPDADGDGHTAATDCDDNDPNVNPGRAEIPGNAVDENCDGVAQPASNPTGDVGGSGSGTETGTGTGTPADLTKPVAVLTFSKQRLARALERGFGTTASTTEAGRLVLEVLYRGKKVATVKRTATRAGSYKLVAKFARTVRRSLGRVRSAKLVLRLTATDLAGNKAVKNKTVTVRR